MLYMYIYIYTVFFFFLFIHLLFQPFGAYLVGEDKKSGAHKLYYPADYSASQCRGKMTRVKNESLDEKIAAFQVSCLVCL